MVEEGKPAPEFELLSDEGEKVKLSSLRGRPVVLYFYPRDDTPGCTKQACGIRDAYDAFREKGAVVLGVSTDTQAAHVRFKGKYGLPFTLLADPDQQTAEDYGVGREGGRTFERSTFVIDSDGVVRKIMRRVNPEKHAGQVLEALA
jgi:thioredoxin-dependent peroxiredoxin